MSRKKRSSAVQDQFRNSLLRLLQENPEVSKADVSRACNVTRSAVSKWVDGTSAIGVDNVPALCDFFNITIDDFFGRPDGCKLTYREQMVVKAMRECSKQGRAHICEQAQLAKRVFIDDFDKDTLFQLG